jgi:hypothetical protein
LQAEVIAQRSAFVITPEQAAILKATALISADSAATTPPA